MSGRDRDGKPREERRRRRDRDRGDRGDRDFDRTRNRDREETLTDENPFQGPFVVLKRPGSQPSSQSQPGSKDKENPGKVSSASQSSLKEISNPKPMILQRSNLSKKNSNSSNVDVHSLTTQQDVLPEKPKASGPLSLSEILKPPINFPFENAMTLIDKNMKIKPITEIDFFYNGKNISDYFVITSVGKPLTGKSSILSFLSLEDEFGRKRIFQKRNRNQEMESSMYITEDHIILIEMASLFNCAAAHDLITCGSQQGTLETTTLTWNLRLMRWAIAISHIVLVVSDNLMDPNLFQLMNSAEIIHSMESALGEGIYPEILFICNKAPISYFEDEKIQAKFQFMFSAVTGRTPRINPNFFILPHIKWASEMQRFKEFKDKIIQFNRYNRAPFAPEIESMPKFPQKYSVQDWYSNCIKLWDEMNYPTFFSSYVKLLP